MTWVHEVPGTTFSNTKERKSYDSEANAILTLNELERWLALAICTYHETLHGAFASPPIAIWKREVDMEKISTVTDPQAFVIDFLPVVRRRISVAD
jgi:putative transposase